jgi:hypothetical protein
MKKYFLLLFLLLTAGYSFGQTVLLKGRVLDAETNEPLQFATIEIHSLHTGTIANEDGVFELAVDSQNHNLDTIEFSYLGYAKTRLSMADFLTSKDNILFLKPSHVSLGEVVVMPKKYKTVVLGIQDNKPESKQISNVFNSKIGNYIANDKNKMGWIKSVSYYMDAEGHPETPFRVRIYDLNKEKNCPGNDILNENLVVSAGKSGWFTIDLTKYNIQFSIDGVFVMMEWINSGDQYFYEKEMPKKNEKGETVREIRKFYGQTIGSVLRQPNMITWGLTLGNDWIPYKPYYKGYINAMIRAEIAYPIID